MLMLVHSDSAVTETKRVSKVHQIIQMMTNLREFHYFQPQSNQWDKKLQ